jgi:alkyl sulfatase BDS1-like metallo-beta-lactamase superfamily hydrolase
VADLLALSARYIDDNVDDGPGSTNRTTGELSEVADGVALIEAFSHVVAMQTDDGLFVSDASLAGFAPVVLRSLRGWTDARINTLLFTHGHIDHVGGASALLAEAADRGDPAPTVVAHENVAARFARYDLTNGYNAIINQRQFGNRNNLGIGGGPPRFFDDWVPPTRTFRTVDTIDVGGATIELHHDRGETDDHAWAWVPSRRAIFSGDFLTWVFPNAGNPQKVQRYPLDWSVALRTMASLRPALLLPAHGLPIEGEARIARVLDDIASALESLVEQTLALMNEGARLDRIVHEVALPAELLARPYLKPTYDEPEFVVRNIWRLYGGWYDGTPAHLKPAPDAALAREIAALAGGAGAIANRARELIDRDPYAAAQLVEYAAQAAPDDRDVHASRRDVYDALRRAEQSLMSRGIYRAAAEESGAIVDGPERTADTSGVAR